MYKNVQRGVKSGKMDKHQLRVYEEILKDIPAHCDRVEK